MERSKGKQTTGCQFSLVFLHQIAAICDNTDTIELLAVNLGYLWSMNSNNTTPTYNNAINS
jgi:hypothetical protein